MDRTDETGTTKRSVPLRPTTIAWRILRLVRSVNGIGRRTTSFLEQAIENVVGGIVPNQTFPRSPSYPFLRRQHGTTFGCADRNGNDENSNGTARPAPQP